MRFRRRPAPDLVVDHLSGKFDATTVQLRALLDRSRLQGAEVITLTEVGSKAKALKAWAIEHGWTLAQRGGHGMDECAILAAPGVRLDKVRVRRLTRLRLKTSRKAPLYAITARARKPGARAVRVASTHLPAHVEGRRTLRKGHASRVYRATVRGLARFARWFTGGRIINADWNLNQRLKWVRDYLDDVFPGTRTGWRRPYPEKGTHGPRLIDGPRSDLKVSDPTERLPAVDGFDHCGTRTVYRLRRATRRRRTKEAS